MRHRLKRRENGRDSVIEHNRITKADIIDRHPVRQIRAQDILSLGCMRKKRELTINTKRIIAMMKCL